MSNVLFPREDVLKSLYELTESITPNRFITTRPKSAESMSEFLLIRLPQSITSPGDTYQLTTGQIHVFARDVQGLLENTAKLDDMLNAVCDLFPIRAERYLATRPVVFPSVSDGAGFHAIIIQFGIRIHKDFDVHQTAINS